MTDTMLDDKLVETPTSSQTDRPLSVGSHFGEPGEHTEAFDACVDDIRRRYGSDIPIPFSRTEDLIRRRLGLAPLTVGAAVLSGLVGVGIRLAVALLATALIGEWAGIPWGRWVPILVFLGLYDATQPMRMPPLDIPPGPRVERVMKDYMALLPTIVHESDLEDLADFSRRWYRLSASAAMGVAVAAIMLLTFWWYTPTALAELPAGSIVLLGFVLYDFGAVAIGSGLLEWAFRARQARYDHHLFWPSPADSPEVQKEMRTVTSLGFATGMWITLYAVLALVLVGWDSPLVLPVAAGFIVIGYLTTIGEALGTRASIQKIVKRVRDQRLQGLQDRIDGFGPSYTDLSPLESEQLRGLMDLHDRIRDAPTTPTTTRTVMHTALGLMIPTIMFVVTVFGEVYAERFLNAILP
ncbi:MAG TPA: hypothetical protein VF148_18585 [Acidimicrobiia bacterium]